MNCARSLTFCVLSRSPQQRLTEAASQANALPDVVAVRDTKSILILCFVHTSCHETFSE